MRVAASDAVAGAAFKRDQYFATPAFNAADPGCVHGGFGNRLCNITGRQVRKHKFDQAQRLDDFLCSPVDTATGKLTGSQAWLQILVIPLALAFAAIAIGAVRLFVA